MALTPKERRLVRLTLTVVLGDWAGFRETVSAAPDGEPDRQWREAVLQCHLFCGFPKVVEALTSLAPGADLGRPAPDEVLGEPDLPERGAELFERIYAARAGEVTALLTQRHPDFAAWIQGHAYGRVLTRPGLDADRRELLAVVALAALGPPRQLASHVRGALRCGATELEIGEALDVGEDLIDEQDAALVRRLAAGESGSSER